MIRRNLHPSCRPLCSSHPRTQQNEVERISRSVCESPAVGSPARLPLRPRHCRRSTGGYAGGCLAIVTLALLIACPTKVYHYHRHPSCPPSALNPPVSRCTYYSVFLSLRAAVFSLPLRHLSLLTRPSPFSPSPSLSLSLSLCTFSSLFSTHSYISRTGFKARRVLPRAWKLSRALFELFATVLIRFIATAGRDRRFEFSSILTFVPSSRGHVTRDTPNPFAGHSHLYREKSFPD